MNTLMKIYRKIAAHQGIHSPHITRTKPLIALCMILILGFTSPLIYAYFKELHASASNDDIKGYGSKGYGYLYGIILNGDNNLVATQIGIYWPYNSGEWIMVGYIKANGYKGWYTNDQSWLYYEYQGAGLSGSPVHWHEEGNHHGKSYLLSVQREPGAPPRKVWLVLVNGDIKAEVSFTYSRHSYGLALIGGESYNTDNWWKVAYYDLKYGYSLTREDVLWTSWSGTVGGANPPLYVYILSDNHITMGQG